ncbi:MAG: DNA glycosylase [Eubacterium sp.]|nr:DNA glycosylase [Eubacterium sp.]
MVTIKAGEDFSLQKIADSGQCFRWQRLDTEGNGITYRIPAMGRVLTASQIPEKGEIKLSCSHAEFDSVWRSYFDLDTDYAAIRARIDPSDTWLRKAADYGKGIRILRQDPFETLISFIISQRKSIPAIRTSVEKLCAMAGREGCFPAAADIERLGIDKIRACAIGYRAPYVLKTASVFAEKTYTAAGLEGLDDDHLMEKLLELPGVGIKVASCTMLFGFHRMNAFPKDVWILRALEDHYPNGFPYERYDPYNGLMQQYIFAYYRDSHRT